MKLIIAEKPSVSKSIAGVIGANTQKDGYMEGNGYIASWCFGHLAELCSPEEYDDALKKWTYGSLPIIPEKWKYKVSKGTSSQFYLLKKLMNSPEVDTIICATDAGREGELIFRLVYNLAGCKKPVQRLWISSMEDSAIRDGMRNLQPGRKYDDLYHSAVCRQNADWLVGINGTRLLTTIYQDRGKVLKMGRVQSPTLAMIVERDRQIADFVSTPYYLAHIITENGVDAVSSKFSKRSDAADLAARCKGEKALLRKLDVNLKTVTPPRLYDLTTLQRDASRLFGYTAKQTLDTAQSLYEKKLSTYPRTDSQYLTEDMYQSTFGLIECIRSTYVIPVKEAGFPDIKRIINNAKVTDHHAIIPTKEIKTYDLDKLSSFEKNILFLIGIRLVEATSTKHCYEATKAVFVCKDNIFTATGKRITQNGWRAYEDFIRSRLGIKEKAAEEDKVLPSLEEGLSYLVTDMKVTDHKTEPPKHYTEDTLLAAMERAGSDEMDDDVERKGLGTTATRADIIEKLIKDGYVVREKKTLKSTRDGQDLVSILPEKVRSAKMTAEWENRLAQVSKGNADKDEFMRDIVNFVRNMVSENTPDSAKGNLFSRSQGADSFGKCPNCGAEVVKGKYGLYCKGKCGMSFGYVMGRSITDNQWRTLLSGKRILLKGLQSAGKDRKYDAYVTPAGCEPYTYKAKTGEEKKGVRLKYELSFPQKKK